jgi:hypothetical protein
MRALILVAGAALAVSACSSNDDANNTMVVEDNMATDMNTTMDMNATDPSMTMNGADGMNSTENAMVNDLTNNSADTNLANGL